MVNLIITPLASADSADLWTRQNLFPWGVLPTDAISRTPEEHAEMLARLGFKQVAFDWQSQHVAGFDAYITALKRYHIQILAWSLFDADAPGQVLNWKHYKIHDMSVLAGQRKPPADALTLGEMLELFKRHEITPQLWLIRRMRQATPLPQPTKPFAEWTDEEKNQVFRQHLSYDLTTTLQQQTLRIQQEADHLRPLAQLAASYGLKLGLYKHGGWIGIADNQVAVIERLKASGISNVGLVYQFIHAHDEVDDTTNFPSVWKKMQPHVLAVNITGLHAGRTTIFPILYPSQGDLELQMMEDIEESGWRGPIGLSSEKGGNAELNLRNNLIGLDWLAAELQHPGSGGPRPFPPGS